MKKIMLKIASIAGAIAAFITIYAFITGIQSIGGIKSPQPTLATVVPQPTLTAIGIAVESEKRIRAKWEISASSELFTKHESYDYSAKSAFDDDRKTSWLPGPSVESERTTELGRKMRYGIGQYLEFDLTNGAYGEKAEITQILICNGAWEPATKDTNIYNHNNRAKDITVTFDYDYSIECRLDDDVKGYQKIALDEPMVEASHIRITFDSVYEGTDVVGSHDLMIGEVDITATVVSP